MKGKSGRCPFPLQVKEFSIVFSVRAARTSQALSQYGTAIQE
jgi:hypothetical protein